jgi:hypothetical protein
MYDDNQYMAPPVSPMDDVSSVESTLVGFLRERGE